MVDSISYPSKRNQLKAIDLTLLTELDKLPRDAKHMDDETAEKIWTTDAWSIYGII